MRKAAVLLFIEITAAAFAQETKHRKGPNGLEGWAVLTHHKDSGSDSLLPVALMIARHGWVIRRIEGSPFLWSWEFRDNGRRVAYEAGPLHFAMWCTLLDLRSGKDVESYDCFSTDKKHTPRWAENLEKAETVSMDAEAP